MRLHLAGFPHQRIERDSLSSFMANAWNFADMMGGRGHEIIRYDGDATPDPDEWNPTSRMWIDFNLRIINAVREDDGIVCLSTGIPHQLLTQALPEHHLVEYSPGYVGVATGTHHVFESQAWRAWIAGRADRLNGDSLDTVIPHFYDETRYPLGIDEGYVLFAGRANPDKGTDWTIRAADLAGYPLVTCGFGEWPSGVDARGTLSVEGRNELMSNARALICPTQYFEPGGHVASEALMCGTPVIATNWGCFPEFVKDGENGYCCSSVEEIVEAIDLVGKLDRREIQQRARARFSYDAVAPQFEAYFDRLTHGG